MTDEELRARASVVLEARSWLGTPYHSHGRIKGVGVDCAMLPAEVYNRVGLIPAISPKYAKQLYMHHGEELYVEWVEKFAREIDRAQALPGDMVLWKFGKTFSHGAIIVELPEVIHSALASRSVVLGNIDQDSDLVGRPARFFSFWG